MTNRVDDRPRKRDVALADLVATRSQLLDAARDAIRGQGYAAAVKYPCSPGARYVTGQTLHVNGGAWME